MAADDASVVAQPTVDQVLADFPDAGRDQLIPILQKVQEVEGFLSQEAMQQIGRHLRLPVSKVYGVATFYNQFRFQPLGKHHVQICRGTACHVKGSAKVLDAFGKQLGIKAGETGRDGEFSVEVVACIGACGLAPVITVNGEFHANVAPDGVSKIIKQCKKGQNNA